MMSLLVMVTYKIIHKSLHAVTLETTTIIVNMLIIESPYIQPPVV